MKWNGRQIILTGLVVVVLALDLLLIRYLVEQPLSFSSAISLCLALAGALTIVVVCVSRIVFSRWQGFGDTAQGLAAISAIVAFVVAANIYFLERKDKPRLEFEISASRALVPAAPSQPASVLVGIRVLVRNSGSRRIELRCITLDLVRPPLGQPLRRNPHSPDEMLLERLPDEVPYPAAFDRNCLRREEERKGLPRDSIRPLFGFAPLLLEPGEPDDGYFEVPVSCEYPFARVLVKIRIRPEDRLSYETKAVIPLREICEGNAGGMSEPIAVAGLPGAVPQPVPEERATRD